MCRISVSRRSSTATSSSRNGRRAGVAAMAAALDPDPRDRVRMNRRALLRSGGAIAGVACVLAAPGRTLADLNPDRMWPVYRRYHLLIVSQRDDERNGALTTAVVDVLSRHLPASRPQLVSAADARRIGVL